jgi:lysozyme family protein
MGVTINTLSDWRGEECHPEDVAQLTKEEASSIFLSRYWQVVRGDQLPSGLDCYIADTAVNSGPARAAKILQKLVGTESDGFVGPLTLEAVRKRNPLKLLLDYHAARMDFLLGLKTWDTFGRGWTARCNRVFAVSKDKVQANPTVADAITSTIAQSSAAGTVAGVGGLAWYLDQYGGPLLDALKSFIDPQSIEKLQSVDEMARGTGDMQLLPALIMLVVMTGTSALALYRRVRMFRKGMA